MKTRLTVFNRLPFFVMICAVVFVSACAKEVKRQPVSAMDNPAHHVYSGIKLLDGGNYDRALSEFTWALGLDSEYAPAYYGQGVAQAHLGNFDKAVASLENAEKYAKDDHENAMAQVGYMRMYMLQQEEDWLDMMQRSFDKAVTYEENLPDAYYYYGMASKQAGAYTSATTAFDKVLSINKTLVDKADTQLKLVQEIQRALPGTEVGKQLAAVEKVTRGDVAAIFIHELKLDRVYQRENQPTLDKLPVVRDITGHPFQHDIETVLTSGVRGLEVYPDEQFKPGKHITRGEYAMMIEGIISAVTHDPKLSVKFIGQASPFPDLRSDSPYFNAVMVCTTRGIMEAEDVMKGTFNPQGTVSGADALLIIRKLKEKIRIF